MLFITALFSLLQAAAFVNAANTNFARGIHARHAAIAHKRAPAPASILDNAPQILKKRGSNKKCRARPSSTSITPSPTSVAPVNPGADPNSPPTSQVTTHHSAPTTPNPPHAAPKPSPSPTHSQQQQAPPPSPSPPSGGGNTSGGGGDENHPFPGPNTGDVTFYELGLTACGITYTDSDFVAAVSHILFDGYPGAGANPNDNAVCNQKVKLEYQGRSVDVIIVDRCTGCKEFDLDLSPAAFNQLASESVGRLHGGVWNWIS